MAGEFVNRLIHEKSPYLLQHAHNPIDWYPWGDEAFEAARESGKPIFLSIGFATCHWCHVMARESFEDPSIAQLMNSVFICIKVDREELPEVDTMYMEFATAIMSAGAGWPLNILLTPDRQPFFATTYLPPINKRGTMGLAELIEQIHTLWTGDEKELIYEQAKSVVDAFAGSIQPYGEDLPTKPDFTDAVEHLFELVDPLHGGFKGSPKFPIGYLATLFTILGKQDTESRALYFVKITLDQIRRGGIHDHIGGGFSRYCVDEKWVVPHFEKMLYDNAFLINSYLDAGRCLEDGAEFLETARSAIEYVLRELTHPEGGFYCAEDAEAEGKEGAFYTWTKEEILSAVPKESAGVFIEYFNVKDAGNFEGSNILHSPIGLEEFSEKNKKSITELKEHLEASKAALLKKRQERKSPFKDDKILTSWNALMIDALVKAASTFSEERYSDAAIKATDFIKKYLWDETGLLRRYREGEAKYIGGFEEYAYLIKALLSLFEMHHGNHYLIWAIELAKILERDFKAEGGAFYAVRETTDLLLRRCDYYDGAQPSSNAVHAENLLRLYQITQDVSYLSQAEDIFRASRQFILQYPPASCYHLIALSRYLDSKAPTIIIALDSEKSLEKELKSLIGKLYLPHATFIWKEEGDELLVGCKDKTTLDGQTAVYLCFQNRCRPPIISLEEIETAFTNL